MATPDNIKNAFRKRGKPCGNVPISPFAGGIMPDVKYLRGEGLA